MHLGSHLPRRLRSSHLPRRLRAAGGRSPLCSPLYTAGSCAGPARPAGSRAASTLESRVEDRLRGFGFANLPYGVFSTDSARRRIGVRFGHHVLDCHHLASQGVLPGCFQDAALNGFMDLGVDAWRQTRATLKEVLRATVALDPDALPERLMQEKPAGAPQALDLQVAAPGRSEAIQVVLHPVQSCQLHLPCKISEFTDFFLCAQHACRGDGDRLRPNWLRMPIGYHGRASSVVVSGTGVRRPWGQVLESEGGAQRVVFRPSQWLDYEMEMGVLLGDSGAAADSRSPSSPLSLEEAQDRVFGLVLLNDWSARDIQYWEMAPLGPFLGKSFATSISPWVVPYEAFLEGSADEAGQDRVPLMAPEIGQRGTPRLSPKALREYAPHLLPSAGGADGLLLTSLPDLEVQAGLKIKAAGPAPGPGESQDASVSFFPTAASNLKHLNWSLPQMVAHHASNGCALTSGDLLGTGTLSGLDALSTNRNTESWGSLVERNRGGTRALRLESAAEGRNPKEVVERMFLEDGDVCVMQASTSCGRIRFGECAGEVLPALEQWWQRDR